MLLFFFKQSNTVDFQAKSERRKRVDRGNWRLTTTASRIQYFTEHSKVTKQHPQQYLPTDTLIHAP